MRLRLFYFACLAMLCQQGLAQDITFPDNDPESFILFEGVIAAPVLRGSHAKDAVEINAIHYLPHRFMGYYVPIETITSNNTIPIPILVHDYGERIFDVSRKNGCWRYIAGLGMPRYHSSGFISELVRETSSIIFDDEGDYLVIAVRFMGERDSRSSVAELCSDGHISDGHHILYYYHIDLLDIKLDGAIPLRNLEGFRLFPSD